jgi:hypothetical protein
MNNLFHYLGLKIVENESYELGNYRDEDDKKLKDLFIGR